jgi:hypothetical protein
VHVSQRRRLATLTQRAQIELALQRLERFASLECDYRGQLNEAGVRLVRASIFSSYCDCRTLGVGKRADQILSHVGVETAPVAALEPAGAV